MCETVTFECSGHGVCIDNYCNCNSGLTGVGDFSPLEGADCGINIEAINILNWISFGLTIIVALCYVFSLYGYSKGFNLQVILRSKQCSFIIYGLISCVCILIEIVQQIFNKYDSYVGGSITFTIFYCIGWLSSLFCPLVYMQITLKFLLGTKRLMSSAARNRVDTKISLVKQRLHFFYVYTVVLCLLPSFGQIGIEKRNYHIVGMVFWTCAGVWLGLLTSFGAYCSHTIYSGLDDSNELMKAMRRNIRIASCIIIPQATMLCFAYCMFGFPFLVRKSNYLSLVLCIFTHLMLLPMLLSLSISPATSVTAPHVIAAAPVSGKHPSHQSPMCIPDTQSINVKIAHMSNNSSV
jgi:hypothetical protein